jgi:protein phosphatase 1 regulatory subunit 7
MQTSIRISEPETLDIAQIEADLTAGSEVIVQFTATPKNQLLNEIDALCLKHDSNFNVRFYGDAYGTFNCNILQKIPHVKSLSLDCMMHASNLAVLADLGHLQVFDLGVFHLQETEILQFDSFKNLTKLGLDSTKTKALNLDFLRNMPQLKSLFMVGHSKNIEAIGSLSQLARLWLHSATNVPLHFINSLKQLKQLEFTLGGRDNLDEIGENSIEYLSLGRVRGFNSFNNMANFKTLKCLSIDEQIQLQSIDFGQHLSTLIALQLRDCKTLNAVTGIENLSALQRLNIWQTQVNFDALIARGLPKSLQAFSFSTAKSKEDKLIKPKLLQMGYKETNWTDFEMPF